MSDSPPPPHSARRILVVDDDEDNVATLEDVLLAEGYVVFTARDGHEALVFLEKGAQLPDLVLLDLAMPGLDGHELSRLLADSPRLCGIPVLVLSAMPPRAQDAAFGRPVLRKPLSLQSLLAAIDAVFIR
jgi:CheY-like chemotaxis protein